MIQAAYKSQVKKSVRSPSVKGWSSEHEAHPISPSVPGARGAGCGPPSRLGHAVRKGTESGFVNTTKKIAGQHRLGVIANKGPSQRWLGSGLRRGHSLRYFCAVRGQLGFPASTSTHSRCVPCPKWDCQLLCSAGTSGTICDTVGSACPASPPPVRNGGAASDLLLRIMTRPSSRHTLSSHGQPAGVPGAAVSRGAVDHLVAGKAGIEGDA